MKTIFGVLLALGFLAGAAKASTITPAQGDTVVEWGCDYGYGR